jgi:ATP-dependent exoDNAse (exonuclease V) alpha subunit
VSSPSSETLTGVLERIIFFNEENHYTIAELKPGPGAEAVTIVGPLPGVQCGETLQLAGEWTRHAQHGAQFKILSFKSELPSSVYGIRKYLGSGLVPGIGKVYANKIVDVFGTDTFRVLSEESGQLRRVPGIGKMRAASIKSAWEEQKTLREVHIFLQTYGVTTSQCVRIVKKWGAQAQPIITREPYQLAREIDGIGFKTADRIAINLGFANDAPPRLDAGLIYALEILQEEGHTAYPETELRDYTAQLLETNSELVTARIAALLQQKSIVRHAGGALTPARNPEDESAAGPADLIQLPQNDRAERKIADVVHRLGSVPSGLPPIKIEAAIQWAQDQAGFEFHPLQKSALHHALAHKFSILTGGPGTGKAQPVDATVLTPTGFRAIGELVPGDIVISAEGAASRVNSVHPQGRKPIFRVQFADGRTCECCDSHLWRVWTRTSVWSPAKKKKVRSRGWRVVPLSYVRDRLENDRVECDRQAVPLLVPSTTSARLKLPCDPYVLGALIGDGTLSDAVLFTTTDRPLVASLARRLRPLGLRLKNVASNGLSTISWRIVGRGKGFANPLRSTLKGLGLAVKSSGKFIPPIYFSASTGQRLELIRGLLDTDGTVDRLGVLSFTTSSPRLAKDFQKLAWSLGCIATAGATKFPTFTHGGRKKSGLPAYTIFLQHEKPATLLTLARKIRRTKRSKARSRPGLRLRVTAIEPAGTAECVCISIDAPSGLYVTDNYIVTHNTTILRALVQILKAKKARVTLAAPTGRAAQRLAETTGGFASTIHRLLAYDVVHGGFEHNENKPLATDFLIVDEASMLDTRLAAALLQAVPARAHLLLVGDIDQLPSVGAGNVLKDLISVGGAATPPREDRPASIAGAQISNFKSSITLPVTRLSFIYRQTKESLIVTTAHAINSGEGSPPPVVSEVAQAQAWSDLNFIVAHSTEDCLAKILELCTKFIPQHFKWFNPVTDVQVLAPMHKGIVGVANLNSQLQAALNGSTSFNPGGSHRPGLKSISGEYRPGDKVIQLRNNYDKNLFNGDIGRVISTDLGKGTLIADFDGERHLFDRGDFGSLGLAYAISIHKSQGSEYPVVIVPLLKAHFMMLQRNLIYTAITRGRKKVFLVGEPAAYAMAVRNAESKLRCTHLREKMLAAGR